ncbi:MAG TPA: CBS domain-containing protein [Candidatus Mcinerneyibacterium sp.]|nr:CBS domain-containing protein [Candidatus Mcinerneyibacterium sp.]
MKIKEVLKNKGYKIFLIKPDDFLFEAVEKFSKKNVGALIVVNKNKELKGIISEKDVIKKIYNTKCQIKNIKIKDIMTGYKDMIIAHQRDSIEYAMDIMTKNKIRHLPILGKKNNLKGIISMGDIIYSLIKEKDHENKMLKDYINGIYQM